MYNWSPVCWPVFVQTTKYAICVSSKSYLIQTSLTEDQPYGDTYFPIGAVSVLLSAEAFSR